MKKLVIRVFVDGKVKRFTAPRFVSLDTFRKTMEMNKLFDSNMPNEILLSKCYPIMCSIFGHQFTVEQLERGYNMNEILKKTEEAMDYVIAVADLSWKGEVIPFEKHSKRSIKA